MKKFFQNKQILIKRKKENELLEKNKRTSNTFPEYNVSMYKLEKLNTAQSVKKSTIAQSVKKNPLHMEPLLGASFCKPISSMI